MINDVKNFSIAEEYFEEDDELIGNYLNRKNKNSNEENDLLTK